MTWQPPEDRESIVRMLERKLAFANEAFLTGREDHGASAWTSAKAFMAALNTLDGAERA